MTESITVDTMRSKLHTLDEVRNSLSHSEPLEQIEFSASNQVKFTVSPGWNHGIESLRPSDKVDAFVEVGASQPYQLTKDALLEAGAIFGQTKAYTTKAPSHLTEDALNYWFQDGLFGKEYKLLVANGVGSAFTKGTLMPFSNLRLLDGVLEGIESRYGAGEVLVDYKFNHSLRSTTVRLILPEYRRTIERSGTDDDTWSTGISIHNSLTGEEQTEVSGYLFRWTCTNGATTKHDVGVWSRKQDGQGENVYDWARESVDAILGGLDGALDDVQGLVDIPLQGDTPVVAKDLFDQYKIPAAQRNMIMERLVNEEVLTMYTLMQAITSTANDPDMNPKHMDRLLRVGGDLPHIANDRCDSCRRVMAH